MLGFTIKAIKWIFLENNNFQVITELSDEEEGAEAQSMGLDYHKSQLLHLLMF